jgi:hypothetical protein
MGSLDSSVPTLQLPIIGFPSYCSRRVVVRSIPPVGKTTRARIAFAIFVYQ